MADYPPNTTLFFVLTMGSIIGCSDDTGLIRLLDLLNVENIENKRPETFAKDIYENHYNFYCQNPDSIKHLVASRLHLALVKEWKCEGVCAIEADPWIDAQDGEVSEPISFISEAETELEASVKMKYIFKLSDSMKSEQHVILLLFKKTGNYNWQVSDLITPNGHSLVKTIEEWHEKFDE